jgi:hypothetical protein
MKYSNIEQNVTPLEMLPELEDLEKNDFSAISMLPPGESEKFGRYIRNYQNGIAKESGMTQNTHSVQPRHIGQQHHHQHHQQHHQQHQRDQKENYDYNHIQQEDGIKTFNMPAGTPSCLDVAEHIANCPICSKFYSTDKTIYIIAIVILSIICILLLKKVLDI